MNASHKPPAGPPLSVGVLAKYVLAYARASDLAEGSIRAWISYMITAGILERATATGQPPFVIKGGVALELRLRNRARATKDLDVALHHPDADLALTLESALTGEPYQGFSFRSKRKPLVLDNGRRSRAFSLATLLPTRSMLKQVAVDGVAGILGCPALVPVAAPSPQQ